MNTREVWMRSQRLACVTVTLLVLAMVVPVSLSAEVEQRSAVGFDFAYYPGDQNGFGVADGGFAPISYQVLEPVGGVGDRFRRLGTGWGNVELKGYYQHQWIIPALRWRDSGLVAGNNVTLRSLTGVSPISITQEVRATLTPIAFLQFAAGGMVGTGWNLQLFDGLGAINRTTGKADPASFEGLVLRGFVSGTFQFDLAALVPGEWNHVVTVISPQWTYSTFTAAGPDDGWMFEADDGTNYNGWKYKLNAFLGYQLPLPHFKMVGILYEGEQLIGNAVPRARAAGPAAFDPAFRTDKIGLVLNFALGDEGRHALTVLPQLQRNRLPSEATIFNAGVQRRDTVGSYWDFYRVAVQYRYSLR